MGRTRNKHFQLPTLHQRVARDRVTSQRVVTMIAQAVVPPFSQLNLVYSSCNSLVSENSDVNDVLAAGHREPVPMPLRSPDRPAPPSELELG